jgi:hypothetical protein
VCPCDAGPQPFNAALGLMPYFRVRVEGKGISVPLEDSTAVGFFATRAVRARSPEEAVEKVRAMLTAAWTTGKYAAWNRGAAPTIDVEQVWRSPWIENLLFKNDGHVFYLDSQGEDEV